MPATHPGLGLCQWHVLLDLKNAVFHLRRIVFHLIPPLLANQSEATLHLIQSLQFLTPYRNTRRTLTVSGRYDTLMFTAKASTLPWPVLAAATKRKTFLLVWPVLSIAENHTRVNGLWALQSKRKQIAMYRASTFFA
jgi:hypothetical protein